MDYPDYRKMFEERLDEIEKAIAFTCTRHGLKDDLREDFASHARLKIMDNDFAVLRKFQGKANLKTYLVTVIYRLYQDYRNHKWGKWRPSAEARRLGENAILFETLTVRDGCRFDEACEILRTNHRLSLSDKQWAAIAARLPNRNRRKVLPEEAMDHLAVEDKSAVDQLIDQEFQARLNRARSTLNEILVDLDEEDRVILKLRFFENMSVVRIAKALDLDQKQLYRRIDKVLKILRKELVKTGVREEDLFANLEN